MSLSKTCVTCGRPRNEFPAIFKNDRACSVICEKTAAGKADAPSECSPL